MGLAIVTQVMVVKPTGTLVGEWNVPKHATALQNKETRAASGQFLSPIKGLPSVEAQR